MEAESLAFFLGSFLSSKRMKQEYPDDLSKHASIEKLFQTLYCFSASKLAEMNSMREYKFLFTLFSRNNRDQLLSGNSTFRKSYSDYESAFNFLEEL